MNNQELQKTQSANSQIALQKPNVLIGEWVKTDDELTIARTFSEKKIMNYNGEDMAELVKVMAQWRLLLGVTTDSTQAELVVICQFIYDNFGKFTLADIKTAMNWSIGGKIDVGFVTQKNISAYYISKCMQSYEARKMQIVNEIAYNKQRFENRRDLDTKAEVTADYKCQVFKEYLISIYESWKENEKFWDTQESIYKWMKSTGQLNPTKEEIDEALIYADSKIRRDKEERNMESILRGIKPTAADQNPEEKRKKYAREHIVCNKFESTDIIQLLKKVHVSYFKNN
jgi:hypothetical protein